VDTTIVRQTLDSDADTQAAGAAFAARVADEAPSTATVILLYGELGAGKTTFSRGFVRAAGHAGAVKSPTYTLMERYDTSMGEIAHLDLYRLNDPEELEYIGFRDLLDAGATLLIEWPQRAPSLQAIAQYDVNLSYHPEGGRELVIDKRLPTG